MKRSGVMIAAVLLVAILFAGNGLLIAHAARPNGQGAGVGDHSNSGNGHHSGSGTNDHSSGSNGGGNSQGSGTVDQNSGTNDRSSQSLSLVIAGGVMNVGSQHYIVQQSGQVLNASFMGMKINQSTSHLNYHLNAVVNGMSVSGSANFHLTGSLVDGGAIDISGNGPIVEMVPALCFPSYSTSGTCESGDTSAVPAFFMGMITIQVTAGMTHTSMEGIPMLFESAYLNPFGGPIFLGIPGSTSGLQIITTYDHATVDWSNILDEGMITSGSFGGTQITTGALMQVAQEHENLVTGNATDHGTITFTDMSTPSLDTSGQYRGTSWTPTNGAVDCSSALNFPANSGMCTNYAFESVGNFHMNSQGPQGIKISGSYQTTWPVPAFSFMGGITATVSP